jgi:hypothetical protein
MHYAVKPVDLHCQDIVNTTGNDEYGRYEDKWSVWQHTNTKTTFLLRLIAKKIGRSLQRGQ